MPQLSFRRLWVLALPLILALLSLGCSLSGVLSQSTPTRAATRRPLPTFTTTPTYKMMITPTLAVVTPTESIPPTPALPSPTPPPADTPTPVSNEVTLNVTQAMNVRSGPGTNYPVIGPAPAGSSAKVLGRTADNSWLQVEYPPSSGKMGWLSAKLVKVTGQVEAVEVAQAPAPPPPPTAKPQPTAPPAPAKPKYQFTPGAWSSSKNEAIIQFRGTIKDEGGNKVNGFSVLVDNGSWSVLAHPTGSSKWYRQPEGQWDVVLPNVATGVGSWTLTVVSYDCPGFFDAGFNGQCKQFTRKSEDIKINVVWPDETIIWADWVCHWDCNKGLYVQSHKWP